MGKYIEFTSTRISKYTGKLIFFSKVGEIQLIDDDEISKYLLTELPSMFQEVLDMDNIQEAKETSPVTEVVAPPMLEDDLDLIKAEVLDSDNPIVIETTEDSGSAMGVQFCNVLATHDEPMILKEVADMMGLSTQKLISVSKRLIEQKKIEKVGTEYRLL
jgi:hypothetical protein